MFIGLIIGLLVGYLSKSILLGICSFYFATGIRKSRLWLGIPEPERFHFLPPLVQSYSISSFLIGVFLWPIVVGFRGDPIKDYFRDIEYRARNNFPTDEQSNKKK